MDKKTVKEHVYDALGFDVIINNAPFVKICGEWILDVDLSALQRAVLIHLAWKSEPLTGSEVTFIRKYSKKTKVEFGKIFGVKHSGVINWEKHKQNPSAMNPATEMYIRFFILNMLY